MCPNEILQIQSTDSYFLQIKNKPNYRFLNFLFIYKYQERINWLDINFQNDRLDIW